MEMKERRHAPRFVVSLEAMVETDDNYLCPVRVFNISSSGLQFSVAQSKIVKLLPNIRQENNLSPVSIKVSLVLAPEINESQTARISCGIVYVKKNSSDECSVGCRFEGFFNNAAQQLEQYINLQASQQFR